MVKSNIKKIISDFDESLFIDVLDSSNGITIFSKTKKTKMFDEYNIFTIPDKYIYDLFLKTSQEIKNFIKDKKIFFDRMFFYCYARPFDLTKNDSTLSLSPEINTCFFALINISGKDIHYSLNNEKKIIGYMDLQIMSYLDIIEFNTNIEKFDMLYISIASVDTLQNQLPNLWIPII